jgi:hypothetical protein
MADGGSFEVNDPKHGMHLDVQAKLLGDKQVCVNIRPRMTRPRPAGNQPDGEQTVEIGTGLQMELGRTAVLCTDVAERLVANSGLTSAEPNMVREQVRTLILVTPELVAPTSEVQPASHQESSRHEDNASEHREGKLRVKSLHIFEAGPGEMVPNVRFARPTIER